MSKLVVDQIQKSGGPALTLPTTSAGAANSLIVGDTSGNLAFSTLGNLLPSGGSGTVLTNDGSGNLSFTKPLIVPADGANIIGTVATSSARQNSYNGSWTSSGPWTTYQNATAAGTNSTYTTQAWNMFLGDGYPQSGATTQNFYAHDKQGEYNRDIHYANFTRVGDWYKEYFYYQNNTSYSGVTWRVLPIRNTTNSSITTTVYFGYSSYDTYSGAACGVFTPSGTGTTYSTQTGGTWSQGFTSTSNTMSTSSMTVTVPANTTVLVMLITSHNYQTTYYFTDCNMFYALDSTFTTGLVCDNRMLNALAMVRSSSATNSAAYPHQIYNACATLFGDR